MAGYSLRVPADEHLEAFRRAFTLALIQGDPHAAEILIREAMDAELTSALIDDEIIAPALYIVGTMWEQGSISVAEEHMATEIVVRVLALQREAERVAGERRGQLVLLAAPAGEHHVVALRMIHNLLDDAGYDVVMLGSDVPIGDLAQFAIKYHPGAICLSATMPVLAAQMDLLVEAVLAERPQASFVVGGRGFTGVGTRHGVEFCDRVTEAVDTVDAIVQRARLN